MICAQTTLMDLARCQISPFLTHILTYPIDLNTSVLVVDCGNNNFHMY